MAKPYWFISIGVMCIAINVYINGVELFLPTFLGFILIGTAAWQLREEDVIFRILVIPAAILAILSFPDLMRLAVFGKPGEPHPFATFDRLTFYPYAVLQLLFLVAVALVIARQALRWNERGVYQVARVAVVAIIAFEWLVFLLPFPLPWMGTAYDVLAIAYMLVLAWAAGWAAVRFP